VTTTAKAAVIEPILEDLEEQQEEPALKRRRTSSEGNVEAVGEEELVTASLELEPVQEDNEEEVKVEKKVSAEDVEGWDDLDADDIRDPVMVSEYVHDIFDHLKKCEVRITFFYSFGTILMAL
jgi:G2/mitotic-specific cyclin 2